MIAFLIRYQQQHKKSACKSHAKKPTFAWTWKNQQRISNLCKLLWDFLFASNFWIDSHGAIRSEHKKNPQHGHFLHLKNFQECNAKKKVWRLTRWRIKTLQCHILEVLKSFEWWRLRWGEEKHGKVFVLREICGFCGVKVWELKLVFFINNDDFFCCYGDI